jgi:Ca2+-dependent lipid-binding protein
LEEQLLAGDKRLLVKVVSAQQLGGHGSPNNKHPYCVVEMDEPPQRYQTSIKKETNSPYWDEHFLL